MQVRVVGGDALMIPFIAACRDANLAISAGVRVAVEWHAKRSGRALPGLIEAHRAWSAKAGGDVAKGGVLVYVPDEWATALDAFGVKLAEKCRVAMRAWLAGGCPLDLVQRTSAQLRARAARLAKDDADGRSQVTIKLAGLRHMVAELSRERGVPMAVVVREMMAAEYLRQTGNALPTIVGASRGRVDRDGPADGTIGVSLPVSWLMAVDAVSGNDRQEWIRGAVRAHFGVDNPEPSRCVAAEAAFRSRQEKARAVALSRSSAPTETQRAQAKDGSRWPVGRGVCTGTITGRPYVGTVARDERAEGVAA